MFSSLMVRQLKQYAIDGLVEENFAINGHKQVIWGHCEREIASAVL